MIRKSRAALVFASVLFALASPGLAGVPPASSLPAPTTRAGVHDFDFLLGNWHTQYRILRKRLVGSHDWYSCDGSSTVTAFWDNAGNLEDSTLNCPTRHVRGVTLRLYSASTHQWSLYIGTTRVGLIASPQVGHFNDSRVGEFFSSDTEGNKPVVIRYRWSVLPGNHPYFEQAESPDGGKNWETDWTTVYTSVKDGAHS